MDHSSKIGLAFGTTSGIITTLGLIVGLTASGATRPIVIGGIVTIAIADAFSDALGIHVSEESEARHSKQEIWISTLITYAAKLLIALTFLVPIVMLSPTAALIVSVCWSAILLATLNYIILPRRRRWQAISEHLLIGAAVVVAGFIIGRCIRHLAA